MAGRRGAAITQLDEVADEAARVGFVLIELVALARILALSVDGEDAVKGRLERVKARMHASPEEIDEVLALQSVG